jgi:hypothetical protein
MNNRKRKTVGLMLFSMIALVLLFFSFSFVVRGEEVTNLTAEEQTACPNQATGFIYNSYSVFVYRYGSSPDGIIRFNDTVHYFNTLNESVTFSFSVTPFHEDRSHKVPLPDEVNGDEYIFYSIPKDVPYLIIPEDVTVGSMQKGTVTINIEITESKAKELSNENGGLIGLMSGTPSVATDIGGGFQVTSVPAYKVFIVLLGDPPVEEEELGIVDQIAENPIYLFIFVGIGIVLFIGYYLYKNLEFVEVEEEEEIDA